MSEAVGQFFAGWFFFAPGVLFVVFALAFLGLRSEALIAFQQKQTAKVKVLTGIGTPLAGTLLTMDLGTMQFRRHRIRHRADCPVCGKKGSGVIS